MRMYITDTYSEIPQRFLSHQIFEGPFQDHCLWEIDNSNKNIKFVVCENSIFDFLTIFEIHEERTYAKCLFQGFPFIGKTPESHVSNFIQALNSISVALDKCLYFPLVYADDAQSSLLIQANAISWARLPSPVISQHSLNIGLVDVAAKRIGKDAYRKIKRFRKSKAKVETVKGKEAFKCIESIEKQSWKYFAQQDIFSRGQESTYRALIASKNTHLRVAYLNDEPIAYRLDYIALPIVYNLKGSFVDQYKKLSPGFYLFSQDLSDCWRDKQLKFFDLHGSMDNQKSAIHDIGHERNRADFAWSLFPEKINDLRLERLQHDQRVFENYRKGNGIRYLYQK